MLRQLLLQMRLLQMRLLQEKYFPIWPKNARGRARTHDFGLGRLGRPQGAPKVISDGIEPPLSDLGSEVLPLHHGTVW